MLKISIFTEKFDPNDANTTAAVFQITGLSDSQENLSC